MTYKTQNKIIGIMPFISLISYVLVSYYTKCYTWPLFFFLLIPLTPYLVGKKTFVFDYDIFICLVYVVVGFATKKWHPYWVLLLTIPVYEILFEGNFKKAKAKIKKTFHIDDDDDIDA